MMAVAISLAEKNKVEAKRLLKTEVSMFSRALERVTGLRVCSVRCTAKGLIVTFGTDHATLP